MAPLIRGETAEPATTRAGHTLPAAPSNHYPAQPAGPATLRVDRAALRCRLLCPDPARRRPRRALAPTARRRQAATARFSAQVAVSRDLLRPLR